MIGQYNPSELPNQSPIKGHDISIALFGACSDTEAQIIRYIHESYPVTLCESGFTFQLCRKRNGLDVKSLLVRVLVLDYDIYDRSKIVEALDQTAHIVGGVILSYNPLDKSSFVCIPELLDACNDRYIPTALLSFTQNGTTEDIQVDPALAAQLCDIFEAEFFQCVVDLDENDSRSVLDQMFTFLSKKASRKRRRGFMNDSIPVYDDKSDLEEAKKDISSLSPDNAPYISRKKEESIPEIRLEEPSSDTPVSESNGRTEPENETEAHNTTCSEDRSWRDSVSSFQRLSIGSDQFRFGQHSDGLFIRDIVEKMTSADFFDLEFTKTVLSLYPKFLKPSELLDRLLDRFDEFDRCPADRVVSAVQLRVCNVLMHWVKNYWCDFHTEKMKFTLIVFLEVLTSRSEFSLLARSFASHLFPDSATLSERKHLQNLPDWCVPDSDGNEMESMNPLTEEISVRPLSQSLESSPCLPFETTGTFILKAVDIRDAILRHVLDARPEELAQQLTLLEWRTFSSIKSRDLLQHVWGKAANGKHGPSVVDSIQYFNYISSWASSLILTPDNIKTRCKIFIKLIQIAKCLCEYKNFNTLMAVMGGINSSSVTRLQKTIKAVTVKDSNAYRDLQDMNGRFLSFSQYKQALKATELPCIPYLGLFLRDLLYLNEAYKDFKADQSVNILKFLRIGDILLMIQNFQSKSYPFPNNEFIEALVTQMDVLNEKRCYERSLEIEPRDST